jgi:hypothetical protein
MKRVILFVTENMKLAKLFASFDKEKKNVLFPHNM